MQEDVFCVTLLLLRFGSRGRAQALRRILLSCCLQPCDAQAVLSDHSLTEMDSLYPYRDSICLFFRDCSGLQHQVLRLRLNEARHSHSCHGRCPRRRRLPPHPSSHLLSFRFLPVNLTQPPHLPHLLSHY